MSIKAQFEVEGPEPNENGLIGYCRENNGVPSFQ